MAKVKKIKLVTVGGEFPQESPPSWAERVPRWYQMDAPSFLLVDAYSKIAPAYESQYDQIIMTSPGASNESDMHFAHSESWSPQKFVYTLPNVRLSSLLSSIHWQGPALCIQHDPESLSFALSECAERWFRGETPLFIGVVKSDQQWSMDQKRNYDIVFCGLSQTSNYELSKSEQNWDYIKDREFLTAIKNTQFAVECWNFRQVPEKGIL